MNPVRAKLLKPEQPLREYVWSSYPEYLKPPGKRWAWLRVDRLLEEMHIPKDSAAGRQQFGQMMEQRRGQEEERGQWKAVRRGWCLGDQQFREELLAQMSGRAGEHHGGEEKQESAEQHAARMVREELSRRQWSGDELKRRRKGDREKVKIAARLRRETTMTLQWIAERLCMGTWTNVANCQAKAKTNVKSDSAEQP